MVENGVLLKPVAVVDREKAWDDLIELITAPKRLGPGLEPNEDEVMETMAEEIHAMRHEDEEKSRSR